MNRLPENGGILLQKAREDAQMVQALLDGGSAPWGPAFHAQQAVEKAIKAVLSWHSIAYPRTHNLGALVELLRAHSLPVPPDADDLSQLTPFGTMLRYGEVPDEDLDIPGQQWLLDTVRRTLEWADQVYGRKAR